MFLFIGNTQKNPGGIGILYVSPNKIVSEDVKERMWEREWKCQSTHNNVSKFEMCKWRVCGNSLKCKFEINSELKCFPLQKWHWHRQSFLRLWSQKNLAFHLNCLSTKGQGQVYSVRPQCHQLHNRLRPGLVVLYIHMKCCSGQKKKKIKMF
jgi:hypothetical protein